MNKPLTSTKDKKSEQYKLLHEKISLDTGIDVDSIQYIRGFFSRVKSIDKIISYQEAKLSEIKTNIGHYKRAIENPRRKHLIQVNEGKIVEAERSIDRRLKLIDILKNITLLEKVLRPQLGDFGTSSEVI